MGWLRQIKTRTNVRASVIQVVERVPESNMGGVMVMIPGAIV
jgi:hypothetical protein